MLRRGIKCLPKVTGKVMAVLTYAWSPPSAPSFRLHSLPWDPGEPGVPMRGERLPPDRVEGLRPVSLSLALHSADHFFSCFDLKSSFLRALTRRDNHVWHERPPGPQQKCLSCG